MRKKTTLASLAYVLRRSACWGLSLLLIFCSQSCERKTVDVLMPSEAKIDIVASKISTNENFDKLFLELARVNAVVRAGGIRVKTTEVKALQNQLSSCKTEKELEVVLGRNFSNPQMVIATIKTGAFQIVAQCR